MQPRVKRPDHEPSKEWEAENRPLLDFLSEQRLKLLHAMCAKARHWDLDGARDVFSRLSIIIRLYHAIREHLPHHHATPTYLVDAEFLIQAFAHLTKGRFEDIAYVTGPEADDDVLVLSRLVPLKLAQRSHSHARADLGDQLRVLTCLEEEGQRLLACIHSHPGIGPDGTSPSGFDIQTQANLEKGGYASIGGIFSRDGHVRFFSHKRRFRVIVTGTRAVAVGQNVFKLTLKKKTKGADRA
jgi:hypothetical protein